MKQLKTQYSSKWYNGNNGDKVIAGLKQAVDKVSSDLQQATIALQIATASTNSSLEKF